MNCSNRNRSFRFSKAGIHLLIPFAFASLALSLTISTRAAAQVPAAQADKFVDSIGINVHIGFTDTVYGNYATIVKPRLQELGVRHVRDGLIPGNTGMTAKLLDLNNTLGIRFDLIASPSTSTAIEACDFIKNTLGTKRVSSVEGINEPDLFIGGTDWVRVTRDYQAALWNAFSGDAATASIPLLTPSVTSGNAASSLGDLTAHSTNGNIHNYYAGRNPETGGWGGDGYGSLTWSLKYVATPISGSHPLYSTETGWNNALDTSSGHRPAPESVAAKYIPRLFLYQFSRGIVRTFPYEFIDEGINRSDIEQNFGLIHKDNTVKPAFTALKNLIYLLKDPGATFVPGSLHYTLAGNTSNVYQTLLQKRDGTFYLALWVGTQNWNPDQKTESAAADQVITLTLPANITSASTVRPNYGTVWARRAITKKSLNLVLNDRVLLVRLVPNAKSKQK